MLLPGHTGQMPSVEQGVITKAGKSTLLPGSLLFHIVSSARYLFKGVGRERIRYSKLVLKFCSLLWGKTAPSQMGRCLCMFEVIPSTEV